MSNEESTSTTTSSSSSGITYSPEDEMAMWLIVGIAVVALAALIPILSKVKRTRGRNILWHLLYWGLATALLFLVPEQFQDIIFSEGGVLVLGTLVPIYESIIAVCTFGEGDDVEWLQFWIVNASFTYATEFMDTIADNVPFVADHWYELEFFITLWFILPWTDGSTLLYDSITVPLVAPICSKMKVLMDGKVQLLLAAVNSGYMYIIWFTFLSLPEDARRFVTIAVGTVYPIIASTVSITTTPAKDSNTRSNKKNKASSDHEETFWLTYWACYSVLFVAMDYLETWVGSIRGFYSICLCATVYLFLPMFRGADAVFRHVLVPLAGQYENLLLRDTLMMRREMERKLPVKHHKSVMSRAAAVFLQDKSE